MKKTLSKSLISLLTVFLSILLISCGNAVKKEVSIQKVDKLTISGIKGGSVDIPVEELKGLPQVTKDVTAVNSSGNKNDFSVKGPLFEDVLKKYGTSQKELKGIRLVAGDNYSIEVPEDVLKNRDIILAVEMNGNPLDDVTRPVRVVVPEERAMYWVKNVVKIEILDSVAKTQTDRIVLVDSALTQLKAEDYKYYDDTDKAFKCQDLLSKFGTAKDADTIFLKASDKLSKNETGDIFSKGYIKFTGKDIPIFLAPDMPSGMRVKNILLSRAGCVLLRKQRVKLL